MLLFLQLLSLPGNLQAAFAADINVSFIRLLVPNCTPGVDGSCVALSVRFFGILSVVTTLVAILSGPAVARRVDQYEEDGYKSSSSCGNGKRRDYRKRVVSRDEHEGGRRKKWHSEQMRPVI